MIPDLPFAYLPHQRVIDVGIITMDGGVPLSGVISGADHSHIIVGELSVVDVGSLAPHEWRCQPPLLEAVKHVVAARSKKKMSRVAARRVVALVANEQGSGFNPVLQLEGQSMGAIPLSVVMGKSITLRVTATLKLPAGVFSSRAIKAIPKMFWGILAGHSVLLTLGAVPGLSNQRPDLSLEYS